MTHALRRPFVNLLFLERGFAYQKIYEFLPLSATDGKFCINKQAHSDSYTDPAQHMYHSK